VCQRSKKVFVGLDTHKLMKNELFRGSLNNVKWHAYDAVITAIENVLGKNQSLDYKVIVAELLDSS